MAKVLYSVHRALSELKMYDSKIKDCYDSMYVIANKKSNDKIQGKTIDETKRMIQGNFDKVFALIENRKRIKDVVVSSNASVVVKIGNKEYTVAEAIERKNSIHYEKDLLMHLQTQYTRNNNIVESENAQIPFKLESYLQSILGEKDKRVPSEIEEHTRLFENRNKWELIDPSNISDRIQKLLDAIYEFENEVDYILSESNATTKLEIELLS